MNVHSNFKSCLLKSILAFFLAFSFIGVSEARVSVGVNFGGYAPYGYYSPGYYDDYYYNRPYYNYGYGPTIWIGGGHRWHHHHEWHHHGYYSY